MNYRKAYLVGIIYLSAAVYGAVKLIILEPAVPDLYIMSILTIAGIVVLIIDLDKEEKDKQVK